MLFVTPKNKLNFKKILYNWLIMLNFALLKRKKRKNDAKQTT